MYYVYMVANRWKTTLYTGVTNSMERRIWQHKHGKIPGFTKKYNCNRLVHHEMFERVESAIAREKQIKGWTRAKKNALIEVENPNWDDLAADWYGDNVPAPDSGGPSPSARLRMTGEGETT